MNKWLRRSLLGLFTVSMMLICSACNSDSDDANDDTNNTNDTAVSFGTTGQGSYDPSAPTDANLTVYNRSKSFSLTTYIDGFLLGNVSPNTFRSFKVSSGEYFVQANVGNGTQPVIAVDISKAEDEFVFVYDSGSPQISLTPR